MTSQLPIVFIAALGEPGRYWQPVLDRLGDLTTVTYDRPGIGDAPPRPAPRPPVAYSVLADELAALLDARGVPGPVVVAAHSIGSLIARVLADRHPHRVAGLIHIDGSMPQFHLLPGLESPEDGETGDPDAAVLDIVAGQTEVLYAASPKVPTLVLTRTPGAWDGRHPAPPGAEELWLAHQRALARDAGAPLVVADDSGHYLPTVQPDLVAYAIRAVHTAAVTGRPVELDPTALRAAGGHRDRAVTH
ncbi:MULTISPECIES: alpha/beta fold hydrolase [unclassified Actinoplanes]|uniref:alpha/beta fold hydrolase n=1 Tax=unclassified Actinoplanes TaxID=2626549 RepID=UPI0002F73238|nr:MULTISPECIES: alpha/beta hydrolase [unclassified Actinoplanes]